MSCADLESIAEKFNAFTQKPVKFLTVQNDVKEDIKHLVKSLYDFTKSQELSKEPTKSSALSSLIVNDFDEEQIWQEIELQNNDCWDRLVWDVANSMTSKNELIFPIKDPTASTDNISNEEGKFEENSEESDEYENTETENEEQVTEAEKDDKQKDKSKIKKSIVDDQFFKLQEMEKFLISEEKKEGIQNVKDDSDNESIDLFEDFESEESEDDEDKKDAMYADFFMENDEQDQDDTKETKRKGKKVTFADDSNESEEENEALNDDGDSGEDSQEEKDSEEDNSNTTKISKSDKDDKKSEFELRQQRLQQHISKLEDKTLADAPWQLKGEVDASKRPQNSLLQEVVDFDLTSRPAPIITEQTTITLEDIIKQRVKDKAWDDVVKKEKPVDNALAFRKPEILDHAKSKQSLAQVYESEYLKQKQARTDDNDNEKEPEAHTQIREEMTSLFAKLDALCHYHYTPKAAQPEVKIVSNTPAISMEEVAPVATSNAALLAPEEVKRKHSGELLSKDERTATDKKRERRKKKKLQKAKGKVEKVTEQRNTKKAVEVNDKSLKTSKAFFQQLNDNTNSLIKNKNRKNVKNKGQ